jgi:hypothetical protein
MDTNSERARFAGAAGIAGAVLWAVGLLLQDSLLLTRSAGPLYAMDQIVFILAQTAWVICIVGLIWAGAVGNRRLTRCAPVVMAAGMALWPIAGLLSLVGVQADFLMPVAILIFTVGSLLTTIAVLVVRRWHGWQRFTPLLQVLYYVVVISLSMAVGGSGGEGEPSLPMLLLWSVPFALLGLALITEGSELSVVQTV